MNFLYPISSAILQAASATLDKVTLSIKRVTYKTYNGISFPLIFIFTLIIFLILKPGFPQEIFSLKIIILILISVVFMIITNLLYYKALKNDHLSEMQTYSLISNIPLILLAGFLFIEERNFFIIILSIIAAAALVWSHYERHHLAISKKTLPYFLFAILLSPFAGIINKVLLESLNPITLQLIRDCLIALCFIPIFFKNIKSVPKKAIIFLILLNAFTTVAWILYFFSYKYNGIILTVLIFSIQPLLVYLASIIFLKEKIHWKKLAAFVIILIAITLSQVMK